MSEQEKGESMETTYVYRCTSCGTAVVMDQPDDTGDYETCCDECLQAITTDA